MTYFGWSLPPGVSLRDIEENEDVGYQPNGSNYHDHLCNCPGCNCDGPEPTDEEILVMAWQDLQSVESYIEQQAAAWAAELGRRSIIS